MDSKPSTHARTIWLRRALVALCVFGAAFGVSVAQSSDVTLPPYPSSIVRDGTGRIVDVSWRLKWAPPTLSNPLDVYITNANRRLSIPLDRDAIIHWPSYPINASDGGDVQILGGRNIVSIGGEIAPATARRGLLIKGSYSQTRPRTIHVEGLLIDGQLSEGIDLDLQGERGATVQLENVRVGSSSLPVQGSYAGNHADAFQAWNGPAKLRIDRFTGYTGYQGMMLQPRQFGGWAVSEMGPWDLRRVNLVGKDGFTDGAAYMIYSAEHPVGWPISTEDVWATPTQAGRALYKLADIPGVLEGPAPHGDFVPAGVAGTGYVSPGYLPQS
jgi:hypothetical protein